ncbi:hypothetical protein [Paeniglutamicibacter sp.]|uniref:hypothetical protein n=1 Tax=Paeniglutamicibacter sp. TaxID=1934391 RepID=UPI00398A36AE
MFEVTGESMAAYVAEIVFRLNGPNVTAAGIDAGSVYSTKEVRATPDGAGAFSKNLIATSGMHFEAWYEVGLVWNEGEAPFWDFGIKIQVPAGGPHNIADLIKAGVGAAGNQLLVWVSEIEPTSPAKGQWWFKPSTNDLYRWE